MIQKKFVFSPRSKQKLEDMFNKVESPAVVTDDSRELEAEVDELFSMFNNDQISQEGVVCGCELVRAELYEAQQTH